MIPWRPSHMKLSPFQVWVEVVSASNTDHTRSLWSTVIFFIYHYPTPIVVSPSGESTFPFQTQQFNLIYRGTRYSLVAKNLEVISHDEWESEGDRNRVPVNAKTRRETKIYSLNYHHCNKRSFLVHLISCNLHYIYINTYTVRYMQFTTLKFDVLYRSSKEVCTQKTLRFLERF